MKTIGEVRRDLLLKEMRVDYWEKAHKLPATKELDKEGDYYGL